MFTSDQSRKYSATFYLRLTPVKVSIIDSTNSRLLDLTQSTSQATTLFVLQHPNKIKERNSRNTVEELKIGFYIFTWVMGVSVDPQKFCGIE